jgi:hypothetical protein
MRMVFSASFQATPMRPKQKHRPKDTAQWSAASRIFGKHARRVSLPFRQPAQHPIEDFFYLVSGHRRSIAQRASE